MNTQALNTLRTHNATLAFLDKHSSVWIEVQPVKATVAALRTCVRKIENAVFPDAVTLEESRKITLVRKLLKMIGATELDKDIDKAAYLTKELDLLINALILDEVFKQRYFQRVHAEFQDQAG